MIYCFIIWIFYAEKSLILFHFHDLFWFRTRMKLDKPTAKISHNEIRLDTWPEASLSLDLAYKNRKSSTQLSHKKFMKFIKTKFMKNALHPVRFKNGKAFNNIFANMISIWRSGNLKPHRYLLCLITQLKCKAIAKRSVEIWHGKLFRTAANYEESISCCRCWTKRWKK